MGQVKKRVETVFRQLYGSSLRDKGRDLRESAIIFTKCNGIIIMMDKGVFYIRQARRSVAFVQ